MRKVLLTVACWATIGLAGARADVVYRYITDKANYDGPVGTQVPVQVLLEERVTGASTSKIFADGGLFGAGVMVNSPGGAIFGDAGNFKFLPNLALSPAGFGNPGFLVDASPASATKSGLIVNAEFGFGPKPATGGAGVNTILLGTLNVTIGASPTTLTVTPYGGSSNTITNANSDLDTGTQALNGYIGTQNNPLGNFSFVVGIPEPSSMALCGLIASGMGYAGFRRRKTTVSEPAPIA